MAQITLNSSGVASNGSLLLQSNGTTTAVTIDTAQNVGVGVTPSAWTSGYKAMQVGLYSALSYGEGKTNVTTNAYYNGTNWIYGASDVAGMYKQGNTHAWYTAASGTAGNAITFTQAMTLDASGNLGIGTSSPSYALHVRGSSKSIFLDDNSTGLNLRLHNGTSSAGISGLTYPNQLISGSSNAFEVFTSGSSPLVFGTTGTERARIDSGGEFYIAGTADQGAYNLQCNGTGVWGAGAYVNGSDERIKEEIAPIESSLDVVEKLNPVTYRYKEDWSKDQSTQTGFIAQELLVAMEGKNYVDGVVQQGGLEGYYSVAYQNIIPILTKAIQELKVIVDAQAVEIAALKGTA